MKIINKQRETEKLLPPNKQGSKKKWIIEQKKIIKLMDKQITKNNRIR